MTRSSKRGVTALATTAAALVLTTMASVSAYAFVLSSDSLSNPLSVAECAIQVEEDFDVPDDLGPGAKVTKKVSFRNVGAGECYVRAYLELSDAQAAAWADVDYNTADWTHDEDDGYWYCNRIVAQGASTPPICTAVTIREGADPDELKSFDVIALAEAVLAIPSGDPHPSAAAAFEALAERSPR